MTLDPSEDFGEPAYMDFEEPEAPKPFAKSSERTPWDDAPTGKAVIPRLPQPTEVETGDEMRRGISNRDRAAVNLRLNGASYLDIADQLEFKDAASAKKAVERTLAATHAPEEWDSLRMMASARAERLFERSAAMAGADYLVDTDTGEKIANTERFKWHQQASADLMNWATITGAKAPTKVEVTPDEERMDQLTQLVLQGLGHQDILDAEVIELTEIPDEIEEEL